MTDLTVKLTSPNGSWESVRPIVQSINEDIKTMDFDNVRIEVGDVWSNAPKKNTVIQYNGDSSGQAILVNHQDGAQSG